MGRNGVASLSVLSTGDSAPKYIVCEVIEIRTYIQKKNTLTGSVVRTEARVIALARAVTSRRAIVLGRANCPERSVSANVQVVGVEEKPNKIRLATFKAIAC